MKTQALKLGMMGLSAFCAVAFPVIARAGNAADSDTLFRTMDTNGDGKISRGEHEAGAKRMFDTMDTNKDGKVTAAEMDAAHEKMTGHKATTGEMSTADKIRAVDTNHDGVLSVQEHATGADRMFDMMDTNKDGYLSKAEFETGHAKFMAKPATTKK